jgi:RNA polymerase sigma factor (sigma-70 family)
LRTDAELLRQSRSDAGAFRQLYDRYAERVFAFHSSRTRSSEVARDLTAETFAQAWYSRGRFRDQAEGSAGPWLFGIARHVLAASVRRGALERAASTRLGILEVVDRHIAELAPDSSWLDGLDEAVAAALAELPQEQRQAVELRVVGDLAYAEIAGSLGTTPEAARVRVSRGLAALRKRLTNFKEET